MCDSVVVVPESGPVWVAKNSDREPSESQAVEHWPAAEHPAGARLRCTHVELEQAPRTHAITIARPTWMWGCEMGVNEHGLAVANEAVFTKLPVADTGLTSMDMQRLALERCRTADDALALIIELLARFPQGGRMSHRGSLRYHGSFLLADPRGAWVLETAGPYWAAQRVRGRRSISNGLSIEGEFDRIHPDAVAEARRRGWCRGAADFGFARCFGSRFTTTMAGARARAARTAQACDAGELGPVSLAASLRDHAGAHPSAGLRMTMPCAHASWLPTRRAGQTTASLIAELGGGAGQGPARAWMTGTSAPCLSVFKPVPLALGRPWAATPGEHADDSLWWRHERFHRAALRAYAGASGIGAEARAQLEARAFATRVVDEAALAVWDEHHAALPAWTAQAEAAAPSGAPVGWRLYWRRQDRRDGLATRGPG